MNTLPKIGWIGLGKMGLPMASQLAGAGYPLTVFNRTAAKCAPLTKRGAEAAETVAAAASGAGIVISMVSDDSALEAVALGADGIFANAEQGTPFIDMSTVSPVISAKIAAAAAEAGLPYLRAPVSGSVAVAEQGALVILASGPESAFEQCRPAFETIGGKIFYIGGDEQARYLKLSINIMVDITSMMMGEALAFGESGGLDWRQMIDIIAASAVGAPVIQYKLETLKNRDFAPAFTARQMAKDFDLALSTANAANLPLPITALVRQHWSAMIGSGRGEKDFFAYVEMLEEMAGLKPKT